MDEMFKLNIEPQTTRDYHFTFLSRYPSDNHLCNDTSRWWLLQYEYVLDTNNIPIHGARILLGPNRKPNIKKYILWTDFVHLSNPSCYIYGPLTLILAPILLKPTNILLYVIGNFFSLLVPLSVLFYIFSLLQPFLKLLKFQKGNDTVPSAYDRIYTASILVLLFIVK